MNEDELAKPYLLIGELATAMAESVADLYSGFAKAVTEASADTP